MQTYIILSKQSPDSVRSPEELNSIARSISKRIKDECPGVSWKESYMSLGSQDVVDIVESDDPKQVAKASLIIRSVSKSRTETLAAAPWNEFLKEL